MMTAEEVGGGLVLPFVAQTVAGKAGAGAILLTIFMVSQMAAYPWDPYSMRER